MENNLKNIFKSVDFSAIYDKIYEIKYSVEKEKIYLWFIES